MEAVKLKERELISSIDINQGGKSKKSKKSKTKKSKTKKSKTKKKVKNTPQ
jgi:hypothetical protein